jgi:hypothetical protein
MRAVAVGRNPPVQPYPRVPDLWACCQPSHSPSSCRSWRSVSHVRRPSSAPPHHLHCGYVFAGEGVRGVRYEETCLLLSFWSARRSPHRAAAMRTIIIPCRQHHLPSPRTVSVESAMVHSSCRAPVTAHLQGLCRRSCHACPFLWTASTRSSSYRRISPRRTTVASARARPTAHVDRATRWSFTCCGAG